MGRARELEEALPPVSRGGEVGRRRWAGKAGLPVHHFFISSKVRGKASS